MELPGLLGPLGLPAGGAAAAAAAAVAVAPRNSSPLGPDEGRAQSWDTISLERHSARSCNRLLRAEDAVLGCSPLLGLTRGQQHASWVFRYRWHHAFCHCTDDVTSLACILGAHCLLPCPQSIALNR
jgi:hypothetical protein